MSELLQEQKIESIQPQKQDSKIELEKLNEVNKILEDFKSDKISLGDPRSRNDLTEDFINLCIDLPLEKLSPEIKDLIPQCVSAYAIKAGADNVLIAQYGGTSGLPLSIANMSDEMIEDIYETLSDFIMNNFKLNDEMIKNSLVQLSFDLDILRDKDNELFGKMWENVGATIEYFLNSTNLKKDVAVDTITDNLLEKAENTLNLLQDKNDYNALCETISIARDNLETALMSANFIPDNYILLAPNSYVQPDCPENLPSSLTDGRDNDIAKKLDQALEEIKTFNFLKDYLASRPSLINS